MKYIRCSQIYLKHNNMLILLLALKILGHIFLGTQTVIPVSKVLCLLPCLLKCFQIKMVCSVIRCQSIKSCEENNRVQNCSNLDSWFCDGKVKSRDRMHLCKMFRENFKWKRGFSLRICSFNYCCHLWHG